MSCMSSMSARHVAHAALRRCSLGLAPRRLPACPRLQPAALRLLALWPGAAAAAGHAPRCRSPPRISGAVRRACATCPICCRLAPVHMRAWATRPLCFRLGAAGGAGHDHRRHARVLQPHALLLAILPLHGQQARHGAHRAGAHAAGRWGIRAQGARGSQVGRAPRPRAAAPPRRLCACATTARVAHTARGPQRASACKALHGTARPCSRHATPQPLRACAPARCCADAAHP